MDSMAKSMLSSRMSGIAICLFQAPVPADKLSALRFFYSTTGMDDIRKRVAPMGMSAIFSIGVFTCTGL